MLFSWFITSLAFDLLASLGLRPFCLSLVLVSSFLVPFLLVSFGKVFLWCFALVLPRFALYFALLRVRFNRVYDQSICINCKSYINIIYQYFRYNSNLSIVKFSY